MLKKFFLTVLVLCLALGTAAYAEEFTFTLAGEGTPENPYLIATKEDLLQLADVMNDDKLFGEYNDCHYQLTADIALNDCSNFDLWGENPPATSWTPIGYYHSFKGIFDGNGHTISGLYIHQVVSKDENNHVMDKFGLFGKSDGEIRNLTITKAYVHPKDAEVDGAAIECGVLAGSTGSRSIISGCTIEGVVICEGYAYGGVVGFAVGEIADCSFTGKMIEKSGSRTSLIGGIAGSGDDIRNCSVSAQIICEDAEDKSGVHASIGGITGTLSPDNCIENCTFEGEIISGNYAGGIVGRASGLGLGDTPAKALIRNCTNNGSITAAEDAGGIVGHVLHTFHGSNEVWVEGCTNRGDVHSLDAEGVCAVSGIVGYIVTEEADSFVTVTGCTNEAELCGDMPGGIVGRLMQKSGHVCIEKCTNKGAMTGEGSYAAGILCHIQQWGGNWHITMDACINEGDIATDANAGGIVCFAYSVLKDGDCGLTITNCLNRGNLRSGGINHYMGGILGVDALACAPVNISGCVNEGDLEYTKDVLVDAETLSGALVTLSRTSGGIVGYVGSAPYFTLNTGARTLNNINVEEAYLCIDHCASTGKFIHKEAALADDVDEAILGKWEKSDVDNVLNYFIALEGGVVGTVADDDAYSVNISNCSYANVDREVDDWNRFNADRNH